MAASRPAGAVIADELDGRVPSAVVEFFDVVEEVSLPDVWNGYFLGPVDRVIDAYVDASPRFITVDGEVLEVLTVGSDGGGGGALLRLFERTCAGVSAGPGFHSGWRGHHAARFRATTCAGLPRVPGRTRCRCRVERAGSGAF